jgi:branched-chain amino acid transport system substrate-binding protein
MKTSDMLSKISRYHKSISIILIFIVYFSVSCVSGCDRQQVKEKSLLRIGVLLPLTGPLSQRGEEEKKAIELAVNDFNAQSKDASIYAIFEDSYNISFDAVTEKLLKKETVSAIVASTTAVSRSIFHLANKNKLIMAFLCSDSTIQQSSPYIFRLSESKEAETAKMLEYYLKGNKNRKVVVLYVNNPEITQQMADFVIPGFMRNKIDTVYYEPYDIGGQDLTDTVKRIKDSGAASLLLLGLGDEYPRILKDLARQKLLGEIEIVGGFSFLTAGQLPQELLEGTIVAAPEYLLQKNEKAIAFEERFSKLYGHAPSLYAAFAYNGMQILLEGLVEGIVIGKGNADTVSFKVTNKKYNGVMGAVSVDNEGGLTVPMELGVIREGKIKPLSDN